MTQQEALAAEARVNELIARIPRLKGVGIIDDRDGSLLLEGYFKAEHLRQLADALEGTTDA